ncbi:hypothetical protein QZM22_07740 [Burkholderia oklahomensis]|uniref:hypothetical protein n=1 Tax=Burkholderia oklahomensis TaxID=342113 RepID=UPI0026501D58|nr:hypothetical protein [Burkholderia oklahomensis]MDN7672412.1 hypothetical protein [Burkholderia oklahomensis]
MQRPRSGESSRVRRPCARSRQRSAANGPPADDAGGIVERRTAPYGRRTRTAAPARLEDRTSAARHYRGSRARFRSGGIEAAVEIETGSEANSDSDSEAKAEIEIEAESQSDIEAETNDETEADADIEAEPERAQRQRCLLRWTSEMS